MDYPQFTGNSGTIAAGDTEQFEISVGPSLFNILSLEAVSNGPAGTNPLLSIRFFTSSDYATNHRLARWEESADPTYYPIDRTTGAAVQGLYGFPIPYTDLDVAGKLYVEIKNLDTVDHDYDVTGYYYELPQMSAGGAPTFRSPVTVPNGGTGAATLTSNGVLYGNGTGAVQATAAGAANSVLVSAGAAPSFSTTPTIATITALTRMVSPTIGPASGQQHTLPAVTSDTVALLAASQTFTNKTLTTPTINDGALSGTFTGTPTFSGVPIFSAGINVGTSQAINSTTSRLEQIGAATIGTWSATGLAMNTLALSGITALTTSGKFTMGTSQAIDSTTSRLEQIGASTIATWSATGLAMNSLAVSGVTTLATSGAITTTSASSRQNIVQTSSDNTFSSWYATNSGTLNGGLELSQYGSTFAGTEISGVNRAGLSLLGAGSSTGTGLLIKVTAASPLLFATNNTLALTINSSQQTIAAGRIYGTAGTGSGFYIGPVSGPSANASAYFKMVASNTVINWQIATNDTQAGALEFTPSTATGGSTFTTPAFYLSSAGAAVFASTIQGTTITATSGYLLTGASSFTWQRGGVGTYTASVTSIISGDTSDLRFLPSTNAAGYVFTTSTSGGSNTDALTIDRNAAAVFASTLQGTTITATTAFNSPGNVTDVAGIALTRTSGSLEVTATTTTSGTANYRGLGYSTGTNIVASGGGANLVLTNKDTTNGNFTSIDARDASGSQIGLIAFISDNQTTHAGSLAFAVANTSGTRVRYWNLTNAGVWQPNLDNTYDIGDTSDRVRSVFVGTSISAGVAAPSAGNFAFRVGTIVGILKADALTAGTPTVTVFDIQNSSGTNTPRVELTLEGVAANSVSFRAAGTASLAEYWRATTSSSQKVFGINPAASDIDLKVQSSANGNAFYVDAGQFSGAGAVYVGGTGSGDSSYFGMNRPDMTVPGTNTTYFDFYIRNGNTLTTPASTTMTLAATMRLDPMTLALGSSGALTNSATFYISAAPSVGTNQYAEYIAAGAVRWGGYGAGAATFDASGNITSVSDMRRKDLVDMYKAGLPEIKKIDPIIYKWKPGYNMETEHQYAGFSAQNVREALPLYGTGQDPQGFLTLQDRALLAAAINAIKELDSKIEQLKAAA